MADESIHSRFFEQMTNHVFLADLLQEAWYGFGKRIEVLRGEVDSDGYDVVLECNGILRYVQTKASQVAREVDVNMRLAGKPGGCVVWIFRDLDPKTQRMKLRYLLFAGRGRLPSLEGMAMGINSRTKKERPNIRKIKKASFEKIEDTRELLKRLFRVRNVPQ
jgi:hypothetical protein